LRSGRVSIAKFAATLEIWDGDRVAAILYPFAGNVRFQALPDREQGTYPEFKHNAAVKSAPSSLRPSVPPSLPLVRVGQGDFTRDLTEEDLR